jgi:hypothetical protein
MIRFALKALLLGGIALQPISAPAHARAQAPAVSPAAADASPVLVSEAQWRAMAQAGDRYPLFAAERARIRREVEAAMRGGVVVPTPKDPGGGYTHEQHKRNYKAIYNAGTLYRLTGDKRYADFARSLLLEYARLYPTLGPHPVARSSVKGRLFWQALNDSVWLVYASQGYDAIRETLSAEDRRRIDEDVFRRMARFLSEENAAYFDRIHNHATWAAAGVGMTGYVLRDEALVQRALLGTKGDGRAGFLRQIDELFSPDGYYAEGLYYQRYALGPFVIFGRAVERNEPQRRIFEQGGGKLLKAVTSLVHGSYAGCILPMNDAMKDKCLDSEEIVTGVAIAYAQTKDPTLLSVVKAQGRTLLSPEGLAVSQGVADGLAKPFDYRSIALSDGSRGDLGNLVLLRSGGENGQLLVMKNTQQGQGHGHFDRLNWLFFDNGREVVTDYGAARFLNVEAKEGGAYLPENDSWAQQTVAHNTLVVNGRSQFDADWRAGEAAHPTPLLLELKEDVQIASAKMLGAYPGVAFTRTLATVRHPELSLPVVLDLLRVDGGEPAVYDLPLHYAGHVMTVGFPMDRALDQRRTLGDAAGYQHLWVEGRAAPSNEVRALTWMTGDRFYTYRFVASAPSEAIMVESGANDPNFNLRHEPAVIQRVSGQADVSFVSVLEPHGAYDATAETVTDSASRIKALRRVRGDAAEVIVLTLPSGATLALGVADDPGNAKARHRVSDGGRTYAWTGAWSRFDSKAEAGVSPAQED